MSSISAKEHRERLFRKGKPQVRRLEIMDGESYTRDIGVLWAAYKAGSFPDLEADMAQGRFLDAIEGLQTLHDQVWVVDDENRVFSGKIGPVALVCTKANGLLISVEGVPFSWASKRNRFRCAGAFLNMIRHSKKTGLAMVKGTKTSLPFLRPLKKLDLLFYVGRVDVDQYLFSMRGRGSEG